MWRRLLSIIWFDHFYGVAIGLILPEILLNHLV